MSTPLTIDPDAILWSAPAAERAGRPLLVLLHGYGSNEQDLFGLAQYLPEELVVASLRAPGRNQFGYEWFSLGGELAGPAAHQQTETTDRLREEGANRAAEAVRAWLDTLDGQFSGVGLAGFSQGGAIATQVLRQEPDRIGVVANLSGFVAPGQLDGDAELARRRPPVFWARGSADQVIAPFLVERAGQWLPEHSSLTARVYDGLGHGISADTLADLRAFLDERHAG
ncbi:alpha/beta hydrolase [Georgenia sp. SYP-B2076]|uniref:alpha/beta hydrolase n=1 Tax=Georgenia sp. SYP-B2076 TaxID=2495881 RepID=UPI000F8CD10E|nr:alpha/beta hydrolase-fold protein [Georgenia sp. SYP-B2076]